MTSWMHADRSRMMYGRRRSIELVSIEIRTSRGQRPRTLRANRLDVPVDVICRSVDARRRSLIHLRSPYGMRIVQVHRDRVVGDPPRAISTDVAERRLGPALHPSISSSSFSPAGSRPPALAVGDDLLRRAVLDLLVHDFLVAVEREVVALRRRCRPWARRSSARCARARARRRRVGPARSTSGRLFFACSSSVSASRVGPSLSSAAAACACRRGDQPSAVHVVEPDVVGAAGVGLGEEQDRGGDAGVGPEDAATAA